MLAEYHYRVVVLLHATLWAFDAGLEPRHDAFIMEYVLALEFLVRTFRQFKTDCTCV